MRKLFIVFGLAALAMIVGGVLNAEMPTIRPEMTKDKGAIGRTWLSAPLKTAAPAVEPAPMGPHVTIDTTTCRYVEKEPSPGSYIDYQEERYCRLPLPEGAALRRITAYNVAEEPVDADGFIVRIMDTTSSFSRFFVVSERIVDGHYETNTVACTSGGVYAEYMRLREGKKTLDCALWFPVDHDSSVYVKIEGSGKTKPDIRGEVAGPLFPLVRMIQAEYEMR